MDLKTFSPDAIYQALPGTKDAQANIVKLSQTQATLMLQETELEAKMAQLEAKMAQLKRQLDSTYNAVACHDRAIRAAKYERDNATQAAYEREMVLRIKQELERVYDHASAGTRRVIRLYMFPNIANFLRFLNQS